MNRHPNIELLEGVVGALGKLADRFVFLGGSTTILLLTDPAAPPSRASIDVDAIIRIGGLADYHRLGKALRGKGFAEDASANAPVCRWRVDDLVFDVMPTDETILGFGNRWYDHTIETAEIIALPSGQNIRLANAPCFLATKLEAFHGRGNKDYLASEDMEDIITVLDGRSELFDEIARCNPKLRHFLAERMAHLLTVDDFRQALPGHLEAIGAPEGRSRKVLERMQAIASVT